MKAYRRALSIAGFDGSGGAGMQADLKTFSALGCYAQTVLTSLPIQNTTGVTTVYDISLQCIEDQIKSVFDDIGVDVVKIGMLHDESIILLVADYLKFYKPKYVVVDPVMIAKSGHRLLKDNAINALVTKLFPLATIITPNIPEACDLLKKVITSDDDIANAACELSLMGARSVVLKGGHRNDLYSRDCLFDTKSKDYTWFESVRINTINTHGTGCTFSAAIASYLAFDLDLTEAVSLAKTYLFKAIEKGAQYKIGEGYGPVHHFHKLWE